jgi:hypothetical protein
MTTRRWSAVLAAVLTVAGGGGGADDTALSGEETLVVGAALSLAGKLAREGVLTKEGHQYCEEGAERARVGG